MKSILTFSFLIISSISFSQNKIHFGLQANGNFTTGIPSVTNWPSENYKGLDTYSFCYAAGATVDFDLTDKLSLQGGLLFRKSGDRSKYGFEDASSSINPNNGFIYQTNNVPRGKFSNKFNYYGIELPLNVYYALTNKFKIGIGGSVLYNFKASTQKIYRHSQKPEPTPAVIHKNFNFLVNLGLQYKLNEHFYLETKAQYQLTETFLGYFNTLDVPRNYLSLGLSVGYKFN